MVQYDDIYRNIAKTDVQGDIVSVTWKCPISEETIAESNARMVAKKDLGSNLKSELTRGAVQGAKSWFAKLATSILGGAAGHAIRRMGTQVADHVQKAQKYGAEEQKEAIVKAWDKVKEKFEYSQDCMVYVAKKPATPPPLPNS